MPLEIRELIIRALVDPSKGKTGSSSSSSASSGGSKDDAWEYQKSIMDQFGKMLKKKKER